jgi:hypothetical protein
MKIIIMLFAVCLFLSGCITTGPVISKSNLGNLEINVMTPDQQSISNAELYLDGIFVGNLTSRLPVIYAKKGERTIRVVSPGYKSYERKIAVLGDPNHQVLNIVLEKE